MNPLRSLLLLACALGESIVVAPRGKTPIRIFELEPEPIDVLNLIVPPPKPAKQNVLPTHCRRLGRSKGSFRFFGSRVSYRHDPATSTTNRRKRTFNQDFCGHIDQYQRA